MLYREHRVLITEEAAKHKSRKKEEIKSLKVGRKVIIMRSQERYRKSLKARVEGSFCSPTYDSWLGV